MFNTFLTFQPNKTRFLPLFPSFSNDVKKCPFLFYPRNVMEGFTRKWRVSYDNSAGIVISRHFRVAIG